MTAQEVRTQLLLISDQDIKRLLSKGNLVVEPFDRERAINKIAGLDGGCDTCDKKSTKRVPVTYVNGSGVKQDCKDCKNK